MKTRAKSSSRSKGLQQRGRVVRRQMKKGEPCKKQTSIKRITKTKSARAKRISEKYKSSHSVGRRNSSGFTVYSQDGRIFYDLYTKYNNTWKIENNKKSSSPRSISKASRSASVNGLPETTVWSSTSKINSTTKSSKGATTKREASLNAAAKVNILCSNKRPTVKKRISKKNKVEKKILRELGITAIPSVLPKVKRMASINAVALISAVTHDVIHRTSRKSIENLKTHRQPIEINPSGEDSTKELTVELSDDHDDATVAMCMSPEVSPMLSESSQQVASEMRVPVEKSKPLPRRLPRAPRKKISKENSGFPGMVDHIANSSVESIRTGHVVPISHGSCSFQQITHQVLHFAVPDYPTSSNSMKLNVPPATTVQLNLPLNNFPKAIATMPTIPDTHFPYYTTPQCDNYNLIQPTPFIPQLLPVNFMTSWQSSSVPATMTYNFPGCSTQPTLSIYPQGFNYFYQTPLIISNLPIPNTVMPPPLVIQSPILRPMANPCIFHHQDTPSLLPPTTTLFQQPRDPSFNPTYGSTSTLPPYLPGRLSHMPSLTESIPQTSTSFSVQSTYTPPMVNVSACELLSPLNTSSISHGHTNTALVVNPLTNTTQSHFISTQRPATQCDTTFTSSANDCLSCDSLTDAITTINPTTSRNNCGTEVLEYSGKQSVPKNSNDSWLWEGVGFKKPVFFQSETPPVMCQCYKAIRHRRDGMVIRERDNVFICSGPDRSKPPHVAKITALFADEATGAKMMAVLWYYRPEHVITGHSGGGGGSGSASSSGNGSGSSSPFGGVGAHRLTDNKAGGGETGAAPLSTVNRLYASRHCDVNPVECIEDRAYVLTGSAYARFMAQVAYRQSGSPRSQLRQAVPKTTRLLSGLNRPEPTGTNDAAHVVSADMRIIDCEESDHSLPQPDTVSVGSVFICQGVYDYKLRRVLRNPPNLQSTIWGQYIQSRAKPSVSASANEALPLKSPIVSADKLCSPEPSVLQPYGATAHIHNPKTVNSGLSLSQPIPVVASVDKNTSQPAAVATEAGNTISSAGGAPLVGVTTAQFLVPPSTQPTSALSTATSSTAVTSLPLFHVMPTASFVSGPMTSENACHQQASFPQAPTFMARPSNEQGLAPSCSHDRQRTNPVWPSLVLPNGPSWNA